MTETLERYKKEMNGRGDNAACVPLSRFFRGFRMEIPAETGKGWHEVLEIDCGLCLSLSNYLLNKPVNNNLHLNQAPLRFNILLKGAFDFNLDATTRHRVRPGDIWVWNDLTGDLFRTMHSEEQLCGVTLTFPPHLVESWLGNGSCDTSRNLEKLLYYNASPGSRRGRGNKQLFPLIQGMPQANQIMHMARELFRFEKNTLYGKLQFESLALEFLCGLLTLDFGKSKTGTTVNWKIRTAVDEAVDILSMEWGNPPTISALAKRVGINASYLKNGFRQQVGCCIGEFVRQKRMSKALELMESGKYSILEIALFVGYANPSHFASVFKKNYGCSPSCYARQYGKCSEV